MQPCQQVIDLSAKLKTDSDEYQRLTGYLSFVMNSEIQQSSHIIKEKIPQKVSAEIFEVHFPLLLQLNQQVA